MKLRVDRVTVAGTGLEARRLADRLACDLPAALTRALTPGALPSDPQAPGLRTAGRDPVDRIARTIALRVRAELALRQAQEDRR